MLETVALAQTETLDWSTEREQNGHKQTNQPGEKSKLVTDVGCKNSYEHQFHDV